MFRRNLLTGLVGLSSVVAFALACGPTAAEEGFDDNGDKVADDLGKYVDADHNGAADQFDINNDGTPDGLGIDSNGDGKADAIALDTNCDGYIDSIDKTGDGIADLITSRQPGITGGPDCNAQTGTGGTTTGTGGTETGTGGEVVGAGGTATGGSAGPSQLGMAQYQGSGNTMAQYAEGDVFRNQVGYKFMANGWGCKWQNHAISWNGTSFTIASLNGSQGGSGCQYGEYSPAAYPTMFCGKYSNPPKQSIGTCGLPAALSSITSLKTGWRWKANGNNSQYNAAYDIWLGNGGSLSAYLMVWLREPSGQQPAGAATLNNATVAGVPGTWIVWTGSVNGHPIVNYIKPEGQDVSELEFDVLSFYNDAKSRGYNLPGSEILAVAIGYEIWNGPVTNLVTEDFYVDVN